MSIGPVTDWRLTFLLLVALVAGCETIGPESVPCFDDTHCPGGYVCGQTGQCTAMIGASDVSPDGDGLVIRGDAAPVDADLRPAIDLAPADTAVVDDAFATDTRSSDVDVPPDDAAADDTALPVDATPRDAETAASDVAAPDVTPLDAASPDIAVPDAAVPDAAVPDAAVPDTAVPDIAVPDIAVPDIAVPDTAVADTAVPDAALPQPPARPEWAVPVERVMVPAGLYLRGEPGDGGRDDQPRDEVFVSLFFIDATEATTAQWAACEAEGFCAAAGLGIACNNDSTPEHPVNCVTQTAASTYCEAVGGRLPTEAEWEKAARGGCEQRGALDCDPDDAPALPWDDDRIGCGFARIDAPCPGSGTVPVGTLPAGDSAYGIADLVGNVEEWTSDCYAADFYRNSPLRDPANPGACGEVSVRGGHWGTPAAAFRLTIRDATFPGTPSSTRGFRCVYEAMED